MFFDLKIVAKKVAQFVDFSNLLVPNQQSDLFYQ